MLSYSRNKPAQALLLGVSAALLGAASHAATDTHFDTRFTMTAYSNAVGGQEILSGDYKAALTKLSARAEDAAVVMNRCVALTMTAQWPAAQQACNTAVHYAELAKANAQSGALQDRHSQDEGLAIAYSNRAVLKWLTADPKAAEDDLRQAHTLLPGLDVLVQNITALGAHSTIAVVRSAEQR
jgi:hypothetical protein